MVMWRDRHVVYKLGFFGLVLSILAYIVAFALPYWSILRLRDYGYLDQTVGLWQACLHQSMTCGSNIFRNNPAWLNATRAFCSLALFIYLISLVTGYYRNATGRGQADPHHGRHVETTAIVATIVGAVGCAIFAAEFHRIYINESGVGQLYWAFGVVTIALCIAGFSSCAMFAYNNSRRNGRRHRYNNNNNRRTTTATTTTTTTVSGRVPNGPSYSMRIQFSAEGSGHRAHEDELVHIPYFGDVVVTPDQLALGQGGGGSFPLQPPAYESIVTSTSSTGAVGSAQHHQHQLPPPPVNGSGGVIFGMTTLSPNVFGGEAPPPYEEIAKDCVLPMTSSSSSSSSFPARGGRGGEGRGGEAGRGTGSLVQVPECPAGSMTAAAAGATRTAISGTTTAATAAVSTTTTTVTASAAAADAAGHGASGGDGDSHAQGTGSGNRG